VHYFEPLHNDLEEKHLLYCSPVNAQQLQDGSLERIYEQGDIFETMMFGGVVGRIDAVNCGCSVQNLILSSILSAMIVSD
jgi:hypothetical protein